MRDDTLVLRVIRNMIMNTVQAVKSAIVFGCLFIVSIKTSYSEPTSQEFSPPQYNFIIYEKIDAKISEYQSPVIIRIHIDPKNGRKVVDWINTYAWPEVYVRESPVVIIHFMKDYLTEVRRFCVYQVNDKTPLEKGRATAQALKELNSIADSCNARNSSN